MSVNVKPEFEVGDTVYVITWRYEVIPLTIESVKIKNSNVLYAMKGSSSYIGATFTANEQFGPFATEKEAKESLSKMVHSEGQIIQSDDLVLTKDKDGWEWDNVPTAWVGKPYDSKYMNVIRANEKPVFNLQSAVDSLNESNKSASPKLG